MSPNSKCTFYCLIEITFWTVRLSDGLILCRDEDEDAEARSPYSQQKF